MSGQPEFIMTSGRSRTRHDACIVSVGIGEHYQEPLYSTRLHCEVNAPEAWRLTYRELPLGCRPHLEDMYAFKIHAMQRAIDAGFRYVLWMDTAFQPIASIRPLWDVLEVEGWYCPPQVQARLGEYSSDRLLQHFGLSRATAWTIQLVFSGLVGFDMGSTTGRLLWEAWKDSWISGLWMGAHYHVSGLPLQPHGQKTRGHVSNDPGVSGHRHDEAALSAILYQHGLVPKDRGFLTIESAAGFIGHKVPLITPGECGKPMLDAISKTIRRHYADQ